MACAAPLGLLDRPSRAHSLWGEHAGGAMSPSARYYRVTVYLTPDQHRWIHSVARRAQHDGVAISASDVTRLAIERLRGAPERLLEDLVDQAWSDVENLPGRAKRGLPQLPRPAPRE